MASDAFAGKYTDESGTEFPVVNGWGVAPLAPCIGRAMMPDQLDSKFQSGRNASYEAA